MSETSVDPLPAPAEFFLRVPLYKEYAVAEESALTLLQMEFFSGRMDAYCPQCKADSIFVAVQKNVQQPRQELFTGYNHFFWVQLTCSRDQSHQLTYIFRVWGGTVQKIGQFPSLADLSLHDIKKYSAVLGEERFREFTRAIGLAAHGIGVGSFVYLRRIFEFLVEEAHGLARSDPAWDDENYQRSRMGEKIALLEKQLPQFLVQNHSLYGILSKGLHELGEDDCLQAFPIVKVGIEIILDGKLEEMQKSRKLKEAEKAIQGLASSMAKTPEQK